MIDAKNFEKAQKIYNKIKALDTEIIELDKLALLIVNNDVNISFDLSIENLTEKKEEKEKILDEDDSLLNNDSYKSALFNLYFFNSTTMYNDKKENKNITNIKNDISINTSLHILGYLLKDKQDKRDKLLQSLSKIGVSL